MLDLSTRLFTGFRGSYSLAQLAAAETVIALVEVQIYAAFLANVSTREIPVAIFLTQDPYIDRIHQQDVLEICLGGIWHYLINIFHRGQLGMPFHDGLHRPVLGRPVQCWIHLQPADQIIALAPCISQHGQVTGMEQVKRAAGETYPHDQSAGLASTSIGPSPGGGVCAL